MNINLIGLDENHCDFVQVLQLQNREGLFGSMSVGDLRRFNIVASGTCTEEQFSQLEQLWNELPSEEEARCHLPGFAVRAFVADDPIFTATICWQCNNICIYGPAVEERWRVFDADSRQAHSLLQLCREVVLGDS